MPKVLIIEDDGDIRQTIAELLELAGHEVQAASNGYQGVRLAESHIPDIIICDINMPRLNGIETAQVIRANPKTCAIPFIFLSAKVSRADQRLGMNEGADDYLFKPISSKELMDAIRVNLKKVKRRRDYLKKELSAWVEQQAAKKGQCMGEEGLTLHQRTIHWDEELKALSRKTDSQKKEILDKMQTVEDQNEELSISVHQVIKARISRNSVLFSLITLIVLVLLTEGFVDPIIDHHFIHNEIISLTLKVLIALLFRPIEGLYEKILDHRSLKKVKIESNR